NARSPRRFQLYCGNALSNNGCSNNSLMLNLGWAHDTRDNVLFPNSGVLQKITSEIGVPGLDLEYYKIEYKHSWFRPISDNVTFMLNGEIGYADSYGDRDFPFFKNFYVGGVNSVRGYETSAIGPRERDPVTNEDFAVGGTKRLLGNAELYFPIPGMKDSKQLRLSTFIDAGGVYGDEQSVSFDELRY